MTSGIYLDYAATSPLEPAVLQTMMPYLTGQLGNPSSLHGFGRQARQALIDARDSIAGVLGCSSGQLFFTSGGTESDNMALIGAAQALGQQGKTHIVTTSIEHHAVLHACRALGEQGFHIEYVQPDRNGRVNPDDIATALRDDTALVSVMYANNETGVVQPVAEIGRICRQRGVPFHTDAVQAAGALPLQPDELFVDLMSLSAHKIGGPAGIGLLYRKSHVPLTPLFHGGAQERRIRPGTENVAAIVGFAAAFTRAEGQRADKQARLRQLRERFLSGLANELADTGQPFVVNGYPQELAQLAGIVNISFPGIDKETMLMNLDLSGIAASGGSACTSGSLEPSHVLTAMNVDDEQVASAVRFSFGSETTDEEIATTVKTIGTIARRLRIT